MSLGSTPSEVGWGVAYTRVSDPQNTTEESDHSGVDFVDPDP